LSDDVDSCSIDEHGHRRLPAAVLRTRDLSQALIDGGEQSFGTAVASTTIGRTRVHRTILNRIRLFFKCDFSAVLPWSSIRAAHWSRLIERLLRRLSPVPFRARAQ
jgi:hypothetical protein